MKLVATVLPVLLMSSAARADKKQCASLFKAAQAEHESIRDSLPALRERMPKLTAELEAKVKGIKLVEGIEKVIEARRKQWASAEQGLRTLLARADQGLDRWARTATACRSAGHHTNATNADKNKTTLGTLRATIHDVHVAARCGHVTEPIEGRRSIVMLVRNATGISQELHDYAVQHGFSKPHDLEKRIRAACPIQPSSHNGFEKTAKSVHEAWRAAIETYNRFVTPRPTVQEADRKALVELVFTEARRGRTASIVTLLERGYYKMRFDQRGADRAETVLMLLVSSGDKETLEWMIDFARANPDRGSLRVNAKDKLGFTALSYCVASKRCTADIARILLVDLKADRKIKAKGGLDALGYARSRKRDDLIPLLEP